MKYQVIFDFELDKELSEEDKYRICYMHISRMQGYHTDTPEVLNKIKANVYFNDNGNIVKITKD